MSEVASKVLLLDCLQSILSKFSLNSEIMDNSELVIYDHNGDSCCKLNLTDVSVNQLFSVLSFIRGGLND